MSRRYTDFPFISVTDDVTMTIDRGFVPNMRVPVTCFLNQGMRDTLVNDLRHNRGRNFTPALQQAANVAALPGIVKLVVCMPDCHTGYGFPIGGVFATRVSDRDAAVSPGAVGFDISCGVRVIWTNLFIDDFHDGRARAARAVDLQPRARRRREPLRDPGFSL